MNLGGLPEHSIKHMGSYFLDKGLGKKVRSLPRWKPHYSTFSMAMHDTAGEAAELKQRQCVTTLQGVISERVHSPCALSFLSVHVDIHSILLSHYEYTVLSTKRFCFLECFLLKMCEKRSSNEYYSSYISILFPFHLQDPAFISGIIEK